MTAQLESHTKGILRIAAAMALGVATLASATPALAQTTPEGSRQPTVLEEIVVTAQKREEKLHDVPLSIAAVTAEAISAKGANSLQDLQYSIPGLSSLENGGPGYHLFQIRGVSSTLSSSTVGEYLDEIPTTGEKVQAGANGSNIDVRLLDMERVEVLRGPQGTLYGQGSMGGTIRYITASPDLTQYSGSVEGEMGQVTDGAESYKVNGVVNLPLIEDKLGLRLVAGYQEDGGWIDNTFTGQKDINGVDFTVFRGKLLARPTDQLEASLLYLHQESDQKQFGNAGVDREVSTTVDTFVSDRYDLVNGIVRYDFGPVSVLGSAGYIDRSTRFANDFSFFVPILEAPPPFGFGLPPGFITGVAFGGPSEFEIFTSELRFSSNGWSRFNWTAGAYYRDSETFFDDVTTTTPGTIPLTLIRIVQTQNNESFAFFGEANYQLTERLNVLVGARYFEERADSTASSTSFGVTTPGGGSATFDTFNPRFNLRYEFSPTSMIYVNAAKGFRTGGFNVSSDEPGIPTTFGPDSLWSYEAGTKHELFDRRLALEAAVYYNDWTDVHSSTVVPNTNVTVTVSGGKVSGWGTDLSASARPVDGLTLTASYGWNNLEYDTATADKLVGDPVDLARKQTYSASLDYRRPVAGNTIGYFRADYQHAGEAQQTLRNSPVGILNLPEQDIVNLRVGLDFGRFDASVFATNVTDDSAPNFPAALPFFVTNVEQRPRTIGVNLKANF